MKLFRGLLKSPGFVIGMALFSWARSCSRCLRRRSP